MITLGNWAESASAIASRQQVSPVVQDVYFSVLGYISETNWRGACHSSSAMLYILLKERGIDSTIVIGEVFAPAGRFDHSWIEIDGIIYDAAVAYPDLGGEFVGGPVFAGIDLSTSSPTGNRYGAGIEGGLDSPAREISMLSIGGYFAYADQHDAVMAMYQRTQTPMPLWERVAKVGKSCGVFKESTELASTHFEIRRVLRIRSAEQA